MPYSATDTEILTCRLKLPLPGLHAHQLMASRQVTLPTDVPKHHKSSAVLCLLFPKNEQWHLLLIRRSADGSSHSGQVSFPGGKAEPTDENLVHTALREAQEEIGIAPHEVNVLGALTSLYIPVSNYLVQPYLGVVLHEPQWVINQKEVRHVLEVPISYLFDEGRKGEVEIALSSPSLSLRKVPVYHLDGQDFIWGATAMMLSELEQIWKEAFIGGSGMAES